MIETENRKESIFSPVLLAIFIIIIFSLLYYIFLPKPLAIQLHFFDVGQGDAALITTPANQNVLIDGGPNDVVVSKLDKYLPFYHRRLDAIILTHPHADHLEGLLKVLDKYEVKKIYFTGVIHTTPEYLEFLESMKHKTIEAKSIVAGDEIDFGEEIKLEFLYPLRDLSEQRVDNLNNSSIVNKLIWGKQKVLFLGDLELEGQAELIAQNFDISAALVKISHHGSKNGTESNFIAKVSPKYAIISVGKDNKFGHPGTSTLNILKNITTFRTDYDGDINFEMTKEDILLKK